MKKLKYFYSALMLTASVFVLFPNLVQAYIENVVETSHTTTVTSGFMVIPAQTDHFLVEKIAVWLSFPSTPNTGCTADSVANPNASGFYVWLNNSGTFTKLWKNWSEVAGTAGQEYIFDVPPAFQFYADTSVQVWGNAWTVIGSGVSCPHPDWYGVDSSHPYLKYIGSGINYSNVYWDVKYQTDQVYKDFNNWQVCSFFGIASTVTQYKLKFFVSDENSSLISDNTEDSGELYPATKNKVLCQTVKKTTTLLPGTHVAEGFLYDQSDNPISQTGTISFTITAGDATEVPEKQVEDTSTSAPRCQESNALGNVICKVVAFLFYPSSDTLSGISDERDEILTKFPFAYVTDFNTAVSTVSTTSTDVPSYSIDLSTSSLPIDVPVFNEDKIREYAGDSNVTLFRGLMTGALWIGLGFFMFHTIKRLH